KRQRIETRLQELEIVVQRGQFPTLLLSNLRELVHNFSSNFRVFHIYDPGVFIFGSALLTSRVAIPLGGCRHRNRRANNNRVHQGTKENYSLERICSGI